MDVFVTRLEQEYNKSVIVTSPNVPYKVKIFGAKNIKAYRGDEVTVLNPCHVSRSIFLHKFQCHKVLIGMFSQTPTPCINQGSQALFDFIYACYQAPHKAHAKL